MPRKVSVLNPSRLLLPWLAGAVACGGAARPLEPPAAPEPVEELPAEPEPPRASSSAELGGLDERAAEQSFYDSLDALQACVARGSERLEYLGGSIELSVKVGADRQVDRVWAVHSSLGERATEKCMFEAMRSVRWPAPVGGAFGIARSQFEFEPRKGVRPPAVWDAGRVAGVVAGLDEPLAQCRAGSTQRLVVTLYIGAGGKALAGGAASEAPVDDVALDCVLEQLLAAEYPAPDPAPAKVRFQL